jgi:hypothetical protein
MKLRSSIVLSTYDIFDISAGLMFYNLLKEV